MPIAVLCADRGDAGRYGLAPRHMYKAGGVHGDRLAGCTRPDFSMHQCALRAFRAYGFRPECAGAGAPTRSAFGLVRDWPLSPRAWLTGPQPAECPRRHGRAHDAIEGRPEGRSQVAFVTGSCSADSAIGSHSVKNGTVGNSGSICRRNTPTAISFSATARSASPLRRPRPWPGRGKRHPAPGARHHRARPSAADAPLP